MIVHKISVERGLNIIDADADGFSLQGDESSVWLSYEQLDEIVHVLAALRGINSDAFRDQQEPTT